MGEPVHTPTSSFAEELAAIPGGEAVNKCIQCGTCTASCAVARYSDEYRPRQLIQKILLGEREEVLKSELPWLCMTCRLCEERCQEGVSPAEVFHAVRILAAREGHVPLAFRQVMAALMRDGWILGDSYTDFEEEDREDLGLETDLGWNNEFLHRLKQYLPLEEDE
ncbi:MAG: 4Fe-4S dicluster domain-containing protein [Candidatus Thorarchaeota archaeon]